MRPILLEIPHAQVVAWIAAIALFAWAVFQAWRTHAREGRWDIASLLSTIIVVFLIVKFVALNPEMRVIPIFSYGFMIMVAFATSIAVAARRCRRVNLEPTVIMDLGILMVISGILGARLFYVIQFYQQFANRPFWAIFAIWEGGIVYYGGLLLATVVGLWYLHRRSPSDWLRYADIVAPTLALGISFGRLGCFLNGCCWGSLCASDNPISLTYPERSPAWFQHHDATYLEQVATSLRAIYGWSPEEALRHIDATSRSLPVLPTQIISWAADVVLFILTSIFYARFKKNQGETLAFFGASYAVVRYTLETLRGDTPFEPTAGILTMSQAVSVAVVLVSLVAFALLRRAGRPWESLISTPVKHAPKNT